MSQALYRKYRSRSLGELVGQEHVTTVLKRALEKGQIAHAYLLTGPRGTGKTSIARILAHEINGIEYSDDSIDLDIIEIDAASNRRIDDIRDLRERVHISPARAKYKVYIIDEVHMLTGESFNALLKTLEEPPAHVVFILATTEIEKLPPTILSRTQTFHFRRITVEAMKPHLRFIADEEKIDISDEALDVIAVHSEGSLRDAETALDQVRNASSGTITREDAEEALGSVSAARVEQLLKDVQSHDAASVAAILKTLESEGVSAISLTRELSLRLVSGESSLESLNLLDALLDVPKSYSPTMKLFSVLMRSSTAMKTAALHAPALVIKDVRRPTQRTVTKNTAQEPEAVIETAPAVEASRLPTPPFSSVPFEWETFIEHIRKNYIALHSVVSKCQHSFDGEVLTIYSKFKLHKMKLEDAKYNTMITEALQSLTGTAPQVAIVFGAKPITDDKLAGITAIMGGGEEVKEGMDYVS